MTEQQLQDAIVDMARLLNWRVAHFRPARTGKGWRTPVAYDGQGFPDLVLVRDRVIFAELKTDRGRMTERQRGWVDALVHANAEVHEWTPHDWTSGEVEHVLRKWQGSAV